MITELVTLAVLVGAIVVVLLSLRYVRKSRLREHEAVTEAQQAQELKNDFVAMVSHELRTPLTSISGFVETLLESWKTLPSEEVDEFLQIARRETAVLADLVEDILVIPRLEAGRLRLDPELIDLSDIVYETTNTIFPRGTRREALMAMPTGVRVIADKKRVQQVLRNLLENARKYGGDQLLVDGFPMANQYVVVVADNGPGVPSSSIQKVFEQFEQLSKGDTRQATGVGLGLPIARRLARAMGGDVWFERRFPRGSRFCFSIAIIRPESGAVPGVDFDPGEAWEQITSGRSHTPVEGYQQAAEARSPEA